MRAPFSAENWVKMQTAMNGAADAVRAEGLRRDQHGNEIQMLWLNCRTVLRRWEPSVSLAIRHTWAGPGPPQGLLHCTLLSLAGVIVLRKLSWTLLRRAAEASMDARLAAAEGGFFILARGLSTAGWSVSLASD